MQVPTWRSWRKLAFLFQQGREDFSSQLPWPRKARTPLQASARARIGSAARGNPVSSCGLVLQRNNGGDDACDPVAAGRTVQLACRVVVVWRVLVTPLQ